MNKKNDVIDSVVKFRAITTNMEKVVYESRALEEWSNLTKQFFLLLNHSEQVDFRSSEYSYELYIEACKDPEFIKKAVGQPGCDRYRSELSDSYNAIKNLRAYWKFSDNERCPSPSKAVITKKKVGYFLKTMCSLLSKCSDEQLLSMYKTKKGLLHVENEFINKMVISDMQERIFVERVKDFKRDPESVLGMNKDNVPNEKLTAFFDKNPQWRNLKKAKQSYYHSLLNIIDRGSENTFSWFSEVLGKKEMNDLAANSIVDKYGDIYTNTITGISNDWDNLFSNHALKLMSGENKNVKLINIFNFFMSSIQSVLQGDSSKKFTEKEAKLITLGIEEKLNSSFSKNNNEIGDIFPIILKMPQKERIKFHPHMLCFLLNQYEPVRLEDSNKNNGGMINFDYLVIGESDKNPLKLIDLINELKGRSLEENMAYHLILEKNFNTKINMHPYVKDMMLKEHLSKIKDVDDEKHESSVSSFKM